MKGDRIQVAKYGLLTSGLVVGCFALTSVSHNIVVQSLLGWAGLAAIALYFRWLWHNKLPPPKD